MKQLPLKLIITIVCLVISFLLNITDQHLSVRIFSAIGLFTTGWGVCYSVGILVGEIKLQNDDAEFVRK